MKDSNKKLDLFSVITKELKKVRNRELIMLSPNAFRALMNDTQFGNYHE